MHTQIDATHIILILCLLFQMYNAMDAALVEDRVKSRDRQLRESITLHEPMSYLSLRPPPLIVPSILLLRVQSHI